MRSRILLALCAGLLLFSVAACGNDDDGGGKDALKGDEGKAADALAKSMAGDGPTDYQKKNAKCVADGLVREAGVDKLVKVKLITKDLKVAETPPPLTDRKLAGQYADVWVECADIEKQVDGLRKNYPDASDKDFEKYVACIKKIPDSKLHAAVLESSLKDGDQKKVAAYDTQARKCGTIIQPQSPQPSKGSGD